MRSYATAQLIGDRTAQCDATAISTHPSGARAYVLLDGIGSTDEIRDWTRQAARRLARTAARHADAETGLRAVYERYATEPGRSDPWGPELPSAAAVVAVTALSAPVTSHWEHEPHYPDGTPKGRIGTWLGDMYGLALNPMQDGFSLTVIEDTGDGVVAATVMVPEEQRLPLASALGRALDVARSWEG